MLLYATHATHAILRHLNTYDFLLATWQGSADYQPRLLECMQRAGDAIFVPPYFTHGVVNVMPSVTLSWVHTMVVGMTQ
mgnify:CR=1 FL=1